MSDTPTKTPRHPVSERRKIQSRQYQKNYREKLKKRLEVLESLAALNKWEEIAASRASSSRVESSIKAPSPASSSSDSDPPRQPAYGEPAALHVPLPPIQVQTQIPGNEPSHPRGDPRTPGLGALLPGKSDQSMHRAASASRGNAAMAQPPDQSDGAGCAMPAAGFSVQNFSGRLNPVVERRLFDGPSAVPHGRFNSFGV